MSSSKPSNNYPPELRERAIRMVAEVRGEYTSDWAAAQSEADKLGIGTPETVLNWVRKAQVDAGQRPGATSAEAAELRRLRAEVKQLRLANDILKTASDTSQPPSARTTSASASARQSDRLACECRVMEANAPHLSLRGNLHAGTYNWFDRRQHVQVLGSGDQPPRALAQHREPDGQHSFAHPGVVRDDLPKMTCDGDPLSSDAR